MRKLSLAIVLVILVGVTGSLAQAQDEVNIVYPIEGETYPITGPPPGGLGSAYFTASFSVTCGGGRHEVKWGFDEQSVGGATFYDQITVQFVHKLLGGEHLFWVKSDCGDDKVQFYIGR